VILLAAGLPVLAATFAVLLRAAVRPQDRGAWFAVGIALVFEATGAIWLAVPGGGPRFPVPADVALLAFFPAAFTAALLFARARLRRIGPALWLDAAIGGVGAAAIVTQLLGGAVERATGDAWATAIALAYPMGDVLLVVMIVVAVTLRGWRVSPVWMLLAAGLLAHVVADVGYVSSGLAHERRALWVPVLGLVSPLLIAAAAWSPDRPPRAVALEGWRMLVTPTLLALLAGSLLVLDHFDRTFHVAVFLSAATLVLVLVRMALTFYENTALQATRELALTDELTGLANRRLFHERLAQELADGDATLAVAMVDLDRFKELNDTLGHHAGDQLLALLGPRLQEAVGEHGLVARLGGDEFALLLPGAGLARAGAGSGSRSSTRSRSRGSRSSWTRASAPRSPRSTAPRPRRCCSAPTSPCTRRRTPGPASSRTTRHGTAIRASA
jgi:GGDEF domain-containing protein